MARRHFWLFLGLLALARALAQYPPGGELRRDDARDLAPHPQTGRNFSEFWTYQFWLNGGIQIQADLSRANFGSFKEPVCGGDLSVMGFKGRDYFVAREYKARNFVFDPGRERLGVHENIFFEGFPPFRHRLLFTTTKRGVSYFLDLSFDEMVPGAVWGDGVLRLPNGREAGLFFHIPRGRVHGRLAVNGDTVSVEGFGWMDHTYQTDFATRLIDAGYRYAVVPGPGFARVETGYFFQKGSRVFGYGVRGEAGRLALLKPVDITVAEKTPWDGLIVPSRITIDLEKAAPWRFQRREDRQLTSVFQELNRVERFGARLFLDGEIFGCRGTGVVNDSFPALFSFTLIRR